jgi:hypothetical protein
LIHRLLRRGGHGGMLRQPEVIVRAKVQHRLAVAHADGRALRCDDDAFVLVSARRADFSQLGLQMFLK